MKHKEEAIGRHAARGPKARRRGRTKKELIHMALCCLLAVLAAYLLTGVIFGVAVVDGESMTPALRGGDVVVYLRLCGEYERGEIVLVKTEDARRDYIKRVCALPGERASCGTDGSFCINGEPQREAYIYEKTYSKNAGEYALELGENQYFLMGDNRTNSRDSRDYGSVSAGDIAGKALLIIRAF